MEIIVMILAALFVLSALDAKCWSHPSEIGRHKKVRRLPPRTLPERRPRRSATNVQPLWHGAARTSTASGPRWWWE